MNRGLRAFVVELIKLPKDFFIRRGRIITTQHPVVVPSLIPSRTPGIFLPRSLNIFHLVRHSWHLSFSKNPGVNEKKHFQRHMQAHHLAS